MKIRKIMAALLSAVMLTVMTVLPAVQMPVQITAPITANAAVSLSDAEYKRGLHIYEYLKSNTKWNDAAICGVLAHLYQESRYLPTATNKSSGAYGIAQWLGTRKTQLQKLKNYDTVDVQLGFLVDELNNSSDFKMSRTAIQNAENSANGAYDVAYNVRMNFGWGRFSANGAPADMVNDCKTIANNAKTVFFPKFAKTVSVEVSFHRNLNSSDTKTVKETFTAGISNQKFGYKPDGTGRYSGMNPGDVGFGLWEKPGYDMLGWSKDQNADKKSWATYSNVVDSWINNNAPSVDLYAVWKPHVYTVNFEVDAAYGSKQVTYGTAFGELPEPEAMPGCRFVGWYTIDDEEITADSIYTATEDLTLYVHWLPAELDGDCTADGVFDVLDVIALQKWLLAAEDAALADCQAADLNGDDCLDVFDLALMKRLLIGQNA